MRFEDYLLDIYSEDGETLMKDEFSVWLFELDSQDWLKYGDDHVQYEVAKLVEEQNQISIRKLIELGGERNE